MLAGQQLTDLLTTQRDNIQREVVVRLQKRSNECNLGIHIEGFALHDLHPPLVVVGAYYEVTKAMEIRDKTINDARADAVSTVGKAEADYLRRVTSAEVAKAKEVADSQVKWTDFLAWSSARKKLSFDDEWSLLLRFVDDLHRALPDKACADYAAGRAAALATQEEIIDFRLYWDRLGRALQNRDVMLIDAEQMHGRRTLILFDLEQFLPTSPLIGPSDRNAPQRPPSKDKQP